MDPGLLGDVLCVLVPLLHDVLFFFKDIFFLEFSNQLMTIRLAFLVLLSENFLIIYNLKKIALCQIHY